METAPHIVAQNTGEAGEQHKRTVDHRRLLPAPAQGVHTEGHEVFKHRDHRGEAGKGHKQEEQAPPDPAPGHVYKDVGQGDENQARTGVDLHPVAEAGGEDDEARRQRHEGIQAADAHAFAEQRVVLAHVAAENLHGGHAQAQGEERLVHGGADDAAKPRGPDVLGIGHQIEPQPLPGAGKGHAVDRQNHDQDQQPRHHEFADLLQAVPQAPAANQEARQNGQHHPEAHFHGISQHPAKDCPALLRVHSGGKLAGGELIEVADHPAGNGGVVHHQKIAAPDCKPAVDVPAGARLFQGLVALNGAFPAAPAHRQLHGQYGQPHDDQKQQIQQHKPAAAVLPHHIGKFPDVADAYGAARADKQEAQPGFKRFSFHSFSSLLHSETILSRKNPVDNGGYRIL